MLHLVMNTVNGSSANLNKIEFGQVWKIQVEGGYRYGLVVSPDSMNMQLDKIIVVAITARKKSWPTRIGFRLQNKARQFCLEDIASVSKDSFQEKIQALSLPELSRVKITLSQMLTVF